jgi:hypothetical protein
MLAAASTIGEPRVAPWEAVSGEHKKSPAHAADLLLIIIADVEISSQASATC